MEINKIYQGDCLELMKQIEDKSVDLILCDLPYGVTENQWDNCLPIDKLFNEYLRIVKENGAIVLSSIEPFTSYIISKNPNLFKYCIYWKKERGTGFMNAKRQPLRIIEPIAIFYRKFPTYNPEMIKLEKSYKHVLPKYDSLNYQGGLKSSNNNIRITKEYTHKYPTDLICFPREDNHKNLHPTQKPVKLFEYLIKTYTNEGDLVLDNCIGSGTTAVACIRTNRKFIGIELEQKYVEIVNLRIQKELSQSKLNGG